MVRLLSAFGCTEWIPKSAMKFGPRDSCRAFAYAERLLEALENPTLFGN